MGGWSMLLEIPGNTQELEIERAARQAEIRSLTQSQDYLKLARMSRGTLDSPEHVFVATNFADREDVAESGKAKVMLPYIRTAEYLDGEELFLFRVLASYDSEGIAMYQDINPEQVTISDDQIAITFGRGWTFETDIHDPTIMRLDDFVAMKERKKPGSGSVDPTSTYIKASLLSTYHLEAFDADEIRRSIRVMSRYKLDIPLYDYIEKLQLKSELGRFASLGSED